MDLGRLGKRSWEGLRQGVRSRFAVDLRALAALRMALGSILLLDLVLRARHLTAFYTDAGVLPRAVLCDWYPLACRLSLHGLSGGAALQVGLFVAAGVAAGALLAGYRTRWAAAASLVLLVSLHARNPGVLNAGDSLLRRLVFWGLLLPLGARWSLDAAGGEAREGMVASLATVGLLVQVVVVYALNGVLKAQHGAWWSGVAIRRVFHMDQFVVLLGPHLAEHPGLLVPLGRLWVALLVASPLLLLFTGRARGVLAGLLAGGHLWMLATLRLGVFPLVSLAGLLVFVPPGAWDRLEARVPDRPPARLGLPGGSGDAASPGGSADSRGPARGRGWGARIRWGVAAVALGVLLAWNAAGLGLLEVPHGATTLEPGEHRWEMFVNPPDTDVWYTAPGTLVTGEEVEAFHGEPVPAGEPPSAWEMYPTARWRKYLGDVWYKGNPELLPPFATHLCHRWDRSHETVLENVTVVRHVEETNLDGPEPVTHTVVAQRDCP